MPPIMKSAPAKKPTKKSVKAASPKKVVKKDDPAALKGTFSSTGPVLTEPSDVVFSWDDTGSMAPCRAQVRQYINEIQQQLFKDIPNLRMGMMVHGDYCDGPMPVTSLDLTSNQLAIASFIRTARSYHGGDAPECYEQVLHDARSLNWKAGANKVLVLIGDNVPHGPTYHLNKLRLDWRNELGLLLEQGITVYGVQALGAHGAEEFYREIAQKTGGFHLRLEQFSQIPDLVKAVCYKQAGQLEVFERTLVNPAPSFMRIIDTLSGRTPVVRKTRGKDAKTGVMPLEAWRYQILPVEEDSPIKEFVLGLGLEWVKGNGYYEFTKTETVQEYKKVILQDRSTEEFYEGAGARKILGLPEYGTVRFKPEKGSPYRFFVQSTSVNRKLKAGTSFLYQVDTSR